MARRSEPRRSHVARLHSSRARGKTFLVFDSALTSGLFVDLSLDEIEAAVAAAPPTPPGSRRRRSPGSRRRRSPADYVCFRVVRRSFNGAPYMHLELIGPRPAGMVGPMAGGNYAAPVSELGPYPLPIHDRYETAAEYDALSR